VLRTLIVPLDGFEESRTILPWAAWLARSADVSVVLVRAIPWPPPSSSVESYAYLLAKTLEMIDADLGSVRDRLIEQGVPTRMVVRKGDPGEVILGLVHEIDACAVAMATRGRGGVSRLVLGSVAEKVVARAAVPVLLTSPGDSGPKAASISGRYVIPLDGSSHAESALDWAQATAAGGSSLLLVQVIPEAQRSVALGHRVMVPDHPSATHWAVEDSGEYLLGLARNIDRERFSVQVTVRVGEVADQILTAAEDHDADLIVMSSEGRTGPARWLLGSVADEVVRRSEHPVWVVPSRSGASIRGRLAEPAFRAASMPR
jgi:nucleotide-binding universal stress UspA family protein